MLLAIVAAASSAAVSSGGWTLARTPTACTATRSVSPDTALVLFATPFARKLVVMTESESPLPVLPGSWVRADLDGSGAVSEGPMLKGPAPGDQRTIWWLDVPAALLGDARVTGLRLTNGGLVLLRMGGAGLPALVPQLEACARQVLVDAGADAATVAQIAEAPDPIAPAGWFNPRDYPKSALRSGTVGSATAFMRVTAGGQIGACSLVASTGDPALDGATCATILQRGRFHPARDRAGRAIASFHLLTVHWALPQQP